MRFPLFRLLLLAILLLAASERHLHARMTLAIQPIGPINNTLLDQVAESLRSTYDFDIFLLDPVPLPAEAFYPPRKRYRAEKILDYIERVESPRFQKVLAVTAVDISTTKGAYPDWGIFGLAYLSARPCVVSTFRLKRNASTQQMLVRLLKVVRHEVGHTLGLPHCPNRGCVMEDANGSIASVDSGDGTFCKACASAAGPYLLKNGPIGP